MRKLLQFLFGILLFVLLLYFFVIPYCERAFAYGAPINEYGINRNCYQEGKPYLAESCIWLKLGLGLTLEEEGARVLYINRNSPLHPFFLPGTLILGVKFRDNPNNAAEEPVFVGMDIRDFHSFYPFEAMLASGDEEPFLRFCKDPSFCDTGFWAQVGINKNRWSSGARPDFQSPDMPNMGDNTPHKKQKPPPK